MNNIIRLFVFQTDIFSPLTPAAPPCVRRNVTGQMVRNRQWVSELCNRKTLKKWKRPERAPPLTICSVLERGTVSGWKNSYPTLGRGRVCSPRTVIRAIRVGLQLVKPASTLRVRLTSNRRAVRTFRPSYDAVPRMSDAINVGSHITRKRVFKKRKKTKYRYA